MKHIKLIITVLMFALSCITANAQFTLKKVPSKNVERCVVHHNGLSVFVDGNNRYSLHISANDASVMSLSMGNTKRDCWMLLCKLCIGLWTERLATGEEIIITDMVTKKEYHATKSHAGDIQRESVIINNDGVFYRFRLIDLRYLSDKFYDANRDGIKPKNAP